MAVKQKNLLIASLLTVFVSVFSVVGLFTGSVAAADTLSDPVAGDDCGGVKTSIVKCNAKNSGEVHDNGIWAMLLIAVNILTAGVGVVAVAGIVYGAVLYTTAETKSDQVKQATTIITNVVIGLVMFALMWGGINFLIPGGVFAP